MRLMKKIAFLSLFLFSINQSFALNYEINHPCKEKLSAKGQILINDVVDALTLTQSIAKNHNIKIEVVENGIKGFYDLPGTKNFEILNEVTFRAYGWCYAINTQFPEVMPKNYLLQDSDQINWFLGSSTYQNGEWLDYCTPVTKTNSFVCE